MSIKRIIILLRSLYGNYRHCGLKGMLRSIIGKVQGTYPLTPLRQDPDFQLRMRTTDLAVCMQVFDEQQYAYIPPKSIQCIVDAGANIGCSAVYFAKRFPKARIICIEADKGNFESLLINCSPYPNIECLHAALWPLEGQVEILDTGEGAWAFRAKDIQLNPQAHGIQAARIAAITIQGVIDKYGIDSIDLLKMDIEGSEREVLGMGQEVLNHVNVLVVECHDRWAPGCTRNVIEATRGFAYEWVQSESLFFCRHGWLPDHFKEGDFNRISPEPIIS